jgi:hypothetical protein
MSYEKVKIVGFDQIVKKDTGQIFNFLKVELLEPYSIMLNDDSVKTKPVYEKLIGKDVLIPVQRGVYRDKPSLQLTDDFLPLPAPVRNSV